MAQRVVKSLIVYRLSPEKNKDLLKKSNTSDSTHSTDDCLPKKRYLVSSKSGLVYEIVQKSQLNGISIKRQFVECEEPENDLIIDDQYFKYLGLIGTKKLTTESKTTLNRWPLRYVAKIESNPNVNKDGTLILTDICDKPMTTASESDVNSKTIANNCEVSRRKLAKHQWLEEVKDNTLRLGEQKQIDKIKDDLIKRRDKELKDMKKETLNLISCFEISSLLGKRIFVSYFKPLNDLEKYLTIIKCENYCLKDFYKYFSPININNNNSYSVSRITRNRDGFDWNPRNYQHKYCFNRMQRLEKWRQLETGLNWRSRLLKSHCKRLCVRLKRLHKCPLCAKTIEPRHQCHEFESNLRLNNDLLPKDSSNEIIIIGDDFMGQDVNQCISNCKDKEEDDDVIIIGEVIKPTNVLKLRQLLLKSNCGPKIGSSDSTQFMSCNKLKPIQTSNESTISESVSKSDQTFTQNKEFVFGSHLFKS